MRQHPSPRALPALLGLLLAALVAALLVVVGVHAPGRSPTGTDSLRLAASSGPHSDYQVLASGDDLAKGGLTHTRVSGNSVELSPDAPTVSTSAGPAAGGLWTSPWVTARAPFTQLVPSWKVDVPAGSWIQVTVRVKSADGRVSSFDNLARWTGNEGPVRRTSFSAQTDDLAKVATDTVESQVGRLSQWQVRINLYRLSSAGAAASPRIVLAGAVATTPGSGTPATSKPRYGAKTLAVPAYSQMIHRGEYPQYGNGGEAWCSPTSTAMVMAYYKSLPPASDYSWVKSSYRDRVVDHVARITYDYAYEGTGNWPFNTAYAASTGNAFVTRLDDLRQAEKLVQAGIPVITSISFARGALSGAPISASNGHLVVISGFTSSGNVVVNDPAAPSDASVRRTYDRGQFEPRLGALAEHRLRDQGQGAPAAPDHRHQLVTT